MLEVLFHHVVSLLDEPQTQGKVQILLLDDSALGLIEGYGNHDRGWW